MPDLVKIRLVNGPARDTEMEVPAGRGLWCSPAPGEVTVPAVQAPSHRWDDPPELDDVVTATTHVYHPMHRRVPEHGVLRPVRAPVFADGAYLYLTGTTIDTGGTP